MPRPLGRPQWKPGAEGSWVASRSMSSEPQVNDRRVSMKLEPVDAGGDAGGDAGAGAGAGTGSGAAGGGLAGRSSSGAGWRSAGGVSAAGGAGGGGGGAGGCCAAAAIGQATAHTNTTMLFTFGRGT